MSRALAGLVALALLLATVSALPALGEPPSRIRPVLVLVVLSLAWLLVNSPVEGAVLWSPASGHGLTVADLLAVPPLLVAAALAVEHLRG